MSRIPEAAGVVRWFAPTVVAQAVCDEWNARAFFEKTAELDMTRCLAKFGAEVNVRDEGKQTPPHIVATHIKAPFVVAVPLDAGADPRVKGAEGKIVWDLIPDEPPLKETDV